MSTSEAWNIARGKARYGRRDWLVWNDRKGETHAALKTPETLKEALLAVGTQGYFYRVAACNAVAHITRWHMGILAIRNSRYGL